jgi:hypothetical protein
MVASTASYTPLFNPNGTPGSVDSCSTYFYPFNLNDNFINNGGDAFIPSLAFPIIINGTAGDKYDVEMITHCEYIGSGANFGTTKVSADAEGVQLVCEAGSLASSNSTSSRSFAQNFATALSDIALDSAKQLSTAATGQLLRMLTQSGTGGGLSLALMN